MTNGSYNDAYIYINGEFFDRISDKLEKIIAYLIDKKQINRPFLMTIEKALHNEEDVNIYFDKGDNL